MFTKETLKKAWSPESRAKATATRLKNKQNANVIMDIPLAAIPDRPVQKVPTEVKPKFEVVLARLLVAAAKEISK